MTEAAQQSPTPVKPVTGFTVLAAGGAGVCEGDACLLPPAPAPPGDAANTPPGDAGTTPR